jgi:hypothetical protein
MDERLIQALAALLTELTALVADARAKLRES